VKRRAAAFLAALLAVPMVAGATAAVAAAAAAPAAADRPGPRAIWTWEGESYAMLESEGTAAQGIAFLKARSIGTIYLYADAWRGRQLIVSEPGRYRRLLRRLHACGLKVYALLGSGYLHTERYVLPRHREEAVAMLQRVLDYNQAAAPEERFDGVNLDIEPHILAEWSTRKMELLAGLVELSDALMRAKTQSGQDLPVGPAIPFWLDGIELAWKGKRKPVSQHLQDVYDYVALMDYRDHAQGADGLVSHAMDELKYGEEIGRPVLIGIETAPNEIRKVSFHHLDEADLERELAATSRSVGAMRSFGGYVVHHYAAYRRWLGLD
jgi:hypothetical protein